MRIDSCRVEGHRDPARGVRVHREFVRIGRVHRGAFERQRGGPGRDERGWFVRLGAGRGRVQSSRDFIRGEGGVRVVVQPPRGARASRRGCGSVDGEDGGADADDGTLRGFLRVAHGIDAVRYARRFGESAVKKHVSSV